MIYFEITLWELFAIYKLSLSLWKTCVLYWKLSSLVKCQRHPGLHQAEQDRGVDPCPLLSPAETCMGFWSPSFSPVKTCGHAGACPVKDHEDEEGSGAPLIWKATERAGTSQTGEENIGGSKEGRAFSLVQWQGKRPWPQIKIEEIPFKNKERHFYTTGHQTLAQFAQTSCGLSFPGDIKILPGHSSDKPAVDDPAFSWDWTRWIPEVLSDLSQLVILWNGNEGI